MKSGKLTKEDFDDLFKQIDNWKMTPTKMYYTTSSIYQIENNKTYKVVFGLMDEAWYLNDKLHRESGPAYINLLTGIELFYLEGEEISKEDFPRKLKLLAFW